VAKAVQDFGEQVEKGFQPLDILQHTANPVIKLIDAFGEPALEPTLVVPNVQVELGLLLDHPTDVPVAEHLPQLGFVIALDDEGGTVEIRACDGYNLDFADAGRAIVAIE